MHKKGFEMSIELIITIFLAIVTLAAALTVFSGQTNNLMNKLKGFEPPEVEPSASNPLSFHAITLAKGKDSKIIIAFYNNEDSAINASYIPSIECGSVTVNVRAMGMDIAVGETGRYAAIVSVPSETPAGSYPCSMKLSNTAKQFVMEVR